MERGAREKLFYRAGASCARPGGAWRTACFARGSVGLAVKRRPGVACREGRPVSGARRHSPYGLLCMLWNTVEKAQSSPLRSRSTLWKQCPGTPAGVVRADRVAGGLEGNGSSRPISRNHVVDSRSERLEAPAVFTRIVSSQTGKLTATPGNKLASERHGRGGRFAEHTDADPPWQ